MVRRLKMRRELEYMRGGHVRSVRSAILFVAGESVAYSTMPHRRHENARRMLL